MKSPTIVLSAAMVGVCAALAQAAYVMPAMGGAQFGMMQGAAMIHTDITFDGTNVGAHVDTSHGVPMLRPLVAPDEFDPAQPWAVLSGKAYNFQHAWNPSGFITLPANTGIWIERVSQDPELQSYKRPPATPQYGPVFSFDGDRWQWSGAMTHNVYAVQNPTKISYEAQYKVYIGDATTGQPLPAYGSALVTWTWSAVVPEPKALFLMTGLGIVFRRRA
jgi:hypothetical protein